MTTKLVAQVMADPDNDLAEMLRAFSASEDRCWHIDRHVLDVNDAQPDHRQTACEAALVLARKWIEQRERLKSSGLLISRPFAVIDDEWLAGGGAATPPHVYVCIARDESSFAPVRHAAVERHSSGSAILDSLLSKAEVLLRVDGALDSEPGCWLIEPLDA